MHEDYGNDLPDKMQVLARIMQNVPLLKKLGKVDHPVLSKRGMAFTVKETLISAEYILSSRNPEVILSIGPA